TLESSWQKKLAKHLPTPIKIAAKQLAIVLEPKGPGLPRSRNATNEYVVKAPSAETAVQLFAGEWSSRLPGYESMTGPSDLYHDHRVNWFNGLAPFKDKS